MPCMPQLWEKTAARSCTGKFLQDRHHQLDCGLLLADSLDTCTIAHCSWFPRTLKFSLPVWTAVCATCQNLMQSSQLLSATQHITWPQVPPRHVWSPCHQLLSSLVLAAGQPAVCSSSVCSFSWSLPVVPTPWQSNFSPTPDQPLLFPSNLVYFCLTDLLTFAQILAVSFLLPDLMLLWLLGMTHWLLNWFWLHWFHLAPDLANPCSHPVFCLPGTQLPTVTHTSCWSKTNCLRLVSKLMLRAGIA